jgi:hypothetical protein
MHVSTDSFRAFVLVALLLIAGVSLADLVSEVTSGQPDQPDE